VPYTHVKNGYKAEVVVLDRLNMQQVRSILATCPDRAHLNLTSRIFNGCLLVYTRLGITTLQAGAHVVRRENGTVTWYKTLHEFEVQYTEKIPSVPLWRNGSGDMTEPYATLRYRNDVEYVIPYTLSHLILGWIAVGGNGCGLHYDTRSELLKALDTVKGMMSWDCATEPNREGKLYGMNVPRPQAYTVSTE